uniref:hypothetical protein n=1 Tax=Nocardiopsis sp. YSL2 TaxID=2939492 RepID=UPI0026F41C85|nr:hypothetical protein [Nocardiopsis sp. YSL2]
MTDNATIAKQARALQGQRITVYTEHPVYGALVDQGHLGYVTEDLHMTFSRDRDDQGLPPEVGRTMLDMVTGLHTVGEDDIPLRDLSPGQVLAGGPFEGAVVREVEEDTWQSTTVRVRLPGGPVRKLSGLSTTRLPIAADH